MGAHSLLTSMKEKKALEIEMKFGRLVTNVLPIGFGGFFFKSVSLCFMEPAAGVEPATY